MPIDRRTLIQRSCLTAASFAAFPRWAAAGLFRERSRARRGRRRHGSRRHPDERRQRRPEHARSVRRSGLPHGAAAARAARLRDASARCEERPPSEPREPVPVSGLRPARDHPVGRIPGPRHVALPLRRHLGIRACRIAWKRPAGSAARSSRSMAKDSEQLRGASFSGDVAGLPRRARHERSGLLPVLPRTIRRSRRRCRPC